MVEKDLLNKWITLVNASDELVKLYPHPEITKQNFRTKLDNFSRKLNAYSRALSMYSLALAEDTNSRKKIKIDPYIAGGIGQGIGGIGMGVASAISADQRNKKIDSFRKYTQDFVSSTSSSATSTARELNNMYNEIMSIIDKYPEMQRVYNKRLDEYRAKHPEEVVAPKKEPSDISLAIFIVVVGTLIAAFIAFH